MRGQDADDDALLGGLSDVRVKREPTSLPFLEYANRLAPLEAALRANGHWHNPHPWLMTFVGDSEVSRVVGDVLATIDAPTDLGPLGQIVLSPIKPGAISSPLVQLPADDLGYAFNLVRLPATRSDAEASRLVGLNRTVYERVRGAGGTLYPVSALALSPVEWREHFGEDFDRLDTAKKRFDPQHVLTPGYEVF
jgi:FAD/FMN-containing dehydrogenase